VQNLIAHNLKSRGDNVNKKIHIPVAELEIILSDALLLKVMCVSGIGDQNNPLYGNFELNQGSCSMAGVGSERANYGSIVTIVWPKWPHYRRMNSPPAELFFQSMLLFWVSDIQV